MAADADICDGLLKQALETRHYEIDWRDQNELVVDSSHWPLPIEAPPCLNLSCK